MKKLFRRPHNEILIFSDEYPPDGGGAGVVAKQLAQGLSILGRNISLLIGYNKSRGILHDPGKIFTCKRFTLVWPILYANKLFMMGVWRYRYFILNDYVAAYIAGLFFSRSMLNRSVILIHGDDGGFFFTNNSLKHRVFNYERFYRRVLKHSRYVVAASAYAKETFMEHVSVFVDPDKIGYSYMGIEPADLGVPSTGDKRTLGVPDDALLLFSAGRLVEEKGFLDMLVLFEQAQRTLPNLFWQIAGDGPLRNKLEENISRLGLQKRIRLLGYLPRNQLATYYSSADIFWLLSRRKDETFGLVYLEAAWFGCPSIALPVSGVPEAISKGVSGYFYEPGCDLSRLIQMAAQLDRSACHGHATTFLSSSFAEYINQLLPKSLP